MNYEYQWVVTFEAIANTEKEADAKAKKFKQELFNKYAVTDDIWLTGIRRRDNDGRGGSNLHTSVGD